jgi:hypothetical protein
MKNSRENKNFIFSLVSSFFYSKQTKGEKDEDNKANISLDGKERKGACSTGGRTG